MEMSNSEKYKFYRNLSLILGVILTASILLCAFLLISNADTNVPADTTGTADTVETEGATVLQTENTAESESTATSDSSSSEYEHRIGELEKLLENYKQASADAFESQSDCLTLTYLELACYALKYSDNIAFSEIIKSFGYAEHDAMLASLEIAGADEGFLELSAEDCVKYLREIYKYCEKGSVYAKAMKEAMLTDPARS